MKGGDFLWRKTNKQKRALPTVAWILYETKRRGKQTRTLFLIVNRNHSNSYVDGVYRFEKTPNITNSQATFVNTSLSLRYRLMCFTLLS